MTRYSATCSADQRPRTRKNPLCLGSFSQTSLRYLRGELRAEYNVQSDGYGGGTYNHWFVVEITSSAWIILTKGGPNAKYIQTSFYDLNSNPIEGRSIFQADSVAANSLFNGDDEEYFPYVGHAMGAQSDLYNTFNQYRLDRGDERYYPLNAGKYLICISSTRNEPRTYEVGVVIEFPSEDLFILLEDGDGSVLALEDGIDESNTDPIGPIFSTNFIIPFGFNAYTKDLATINPGVTVTIQSGSTWLIGNVVSNGDGANDLFLLDPGPGYDFNTEHEHSFAEWSQAWEREHQQTDRFPEIFRPLITRV